MADEPGAAGVGGETAPAGAGGAEGVTEGVASVTSAVTPSLSPAPVTSETPWTHQLANAELHGAASLTRYQNLDAFVDGHLELERTQGSRPTYPGEEATPEDWQTFYKGVPGFPETAEQYTVGAPQMPPDLAMTDTELGMALGRFHGLGLTNAQADGVFTLLAESNALRFQAREAEKQTHIDQVYDTLQKLPGWGPLTDSNVAVAQEGLRREFGDNIAGMEELFRTGDNGQVQPLRNLPWFVQMAFEYSQMKGHGRFVPGGTNAASIDAAKAAIAAAKTSAERDAAIAQHGPLAYSQDPEGVSFVRGGATQGVPRP